MKCFALDESGDVVLNQNDIQMAQGTDLIMQKIRQVLRTNRGEWSFDEKEGIPVRKILKKNPNIAMIRDYVRSVIDQVDGSLQTVSYTHLYWQILVTGITSLVVMLKILQVRWRTWLRP